MDTKIKNKSKNLAQLKLSELVRIDNSKMNRGELQNYIFILQDKRRFLKRDIDTIDDVLRDLSIRLSKASVK